MAFDAHHILVINPGSTSTKLAKYRLDSKAGTTGSDDRAALVFDGMLYQIAKEIGAMATVLSGRLDSIFLTGGFARERIVAQLSPRIGWIAPLLVYPGEREMIALAEAAARVLTGFETVKEY